MEDTSGSCKIQIEAFLKSYERNLLWMLCTLAMLRVFFFTAAFPFFNNVDEQAHFDTVVKYSKGNLPCKEAINYEYESAELIVLYGSPEYFKSSRDFESAEIPPPIWRFDRKQLSPYISKWINNWTGRKNHEAFSPPIYYALAGAWYDFAKLFGLRGGHLLYWIRFLNVTVYAILFWFIYIFCKNIYKTNLVMQFSILLLFTFFPQDVFYSINSDVLSPLFCVVSLYLFIQIYNSDRSLLFHLLTGIVISVTILVKFSNCPMLIIFTILIFFKIRKLVIERRLKEQLPKLLILISGCLLPIILWLGWNAHALEDITGNVEKVRHLGWTRKSLAEIWDHPIFKLTGLTYFVNELLKTFWRGEFVWGLRRVASTGMDFFYVISSYLFVLFSVINSIASKDDYLPNQRFVNYISALILLFFMLFLAILSLIYNFNKCWYPSQEFPFFTSGRLVLGALVPFLILYLDGLRIIVSKINSHINLFMVVLFICILIVYSEFRMSYTVLESSYNWFHMH